VVEVASGAALFAEGIDTVADVLPRLRFWRPSRLSRACCAASPSPR